MRVFRGHVTRIISLSSANQEGGGLIQHSHLFPSRKGGKEKCKKNGGEGRESIAKARKVGRMALSSSAVRGRGGKGAIG